MSFDGYIVIPERHESLGDQIDLALDKLRTIYMVLVSDDQSWLDGAHLKALAAVLDGAIGDLKPVRDVLQCPPAGMSAGGG